MKRFLIALLAMVEFGLTSSIGFSASPQTIEGAKNEREVVWYGGGSSEIDEVLGNNFSKKYPFIQAKKFRIQSQKLLVRFEAESRSGQTRCRHRAHHGLVYRYFQEEGPPAEV